MKKTVIAVALVLVAAAAFAQKQGTIEHKPEACVPGGEMPLMKVVTHDDGVLRSYFRRFGATDWCSVDGLNAGIASNVILPKFEKGDEIEYYFVVLQKDRIMAKSPQIYRTKATEQCDSPVARHNNLITLECLPPVQNPVASSLAAGYNATANTPNQVSPESPSITAGKPATSKQ